MNITMTKARVVLIAMFVGSLIVQALAVIITYSRATISNDDLTSLLLKLLAIYSVHLGVIFGGIFAQQQDASDGVPTPPGTAFWLAVVLAAIWNLLLLWRCVAFGVAAFNPDSEDNVDRLSSYLQNISSGSAFLVTGSLAFFFAKKK
jgi:hypothetical protein